MSTTVVGFGSSGGRATAALQVGGLLELRLAETPTTGFRWHAEPGPSLRQVDDRYEGPAAPMGAGGVRVLQFQAATPGTAGVRLVLRRAWGDQTPAAEAAVTVTITG